MQIKEYNLKLPTDYTEEHLSSILYKRFGSQNISYQILKKSLDARNKNKIFWNIKVGIIEKKGKNAKDFFPQLEIPKLKTKKKVLVAGSGPAGFFCSYILQKAGFNVTLIEQGRPVEDRYKDIESFEATGKMIAYSNYSFGEGGAGTFSDGKLTSRTKNISLEKSTLFHLLIEGGAPEEIHYLSHPHVGSDKLRKINISLRKKFMDMGGKFQFENQLNDFKLNNKAKIDLAIINENHEETADYYIVAPGHSALYTYKMLMKNGVLFKNKPFAMGVRVEHHQELINQAQWGKKSLQGVKAAEYRLNARTSLEMPVFSFCMCPGGKVVPAAPYENNNIVNGMSHYQRNSEFANSAIVAGFQLEELLEKEMNPIDSLNWLENIEQQAFELTKSYKAPANSIQSFLSNQTASKLAKSSYPFELFVHDFQCLLPSKIIQALKEGMKHFGKKIKGFEKGIMLGLETKTSSPIQVIRDDKRRCTGFENLYLIGEGSGFAGGIVSSAVDGIKLAMDIILENQ